jgi:ElaB/YqjD/DUF883 family membrane-anchored ribosome-binding protein
MQTRSGEEIEASTEKLLRDLKAVVHDGEELLKAGARGLSDRGAAARERLAAALEVAKDTQRKLQQQVVSGAKATDKVIREHPYESVGLAFGIGVLLGILANRR